MTAEKRGALLASLVLLNYMLFENDMVSVLNRFTLVTKLFFAAVTFLNCILN